MNNQTVNAFLSMLISGHKPKQRQIQLLPFQTSENVFDNSHFFYSFIVSINIIEQH